MLEAVRARLTHLATLRDRSPLHRMPPTDRAALGLWLLSRVGTWVLVGASGYLFARTENLVPLLQRWVQWDFHHYRAIAEVGYDSGQPTGEPLEAFFPGFPALLRLVHTAGISYVGAGLLISFVAGTVAVVALARLADEEFGPGTGPRAVLLLVLSPAAVFLAAPYTEALFLGLALPGWLAARHGRWALASLLTAGACSVRVTGLFLAAALVVEFFTGRAAQDNPSQDRAAQDGGRRWRDAGWLLLPAVPVVGFTAYLYALTGDWLRWMTAQEEGWDRRFTQPVEAFLTTWNAAFSGDYTLGFTWMFRAELLTIAVGLLVVAWLIGRREWGELTYVGVAVAAYATSVWYFSVPRGSLLWWPLWIGLASWSLRRRWVLWVYLSLVAPLAAAVTLVYSVGGWAG